MLERKMVFLGSSILLAFITMSVLAPLCKYDPTRGVDEELLPPSREHIMGTDNLGRDVFSRVIWGSRTSLLIALISVLIASLSGIPLGILSGYFGGKMDRILSMIMDSIYSFPGLILAIAIAAVLGPGVLNVSLAIAAVYIPTYFRVMRNTVSKVKNELYVVAARALGAGDLLILKDCVLPNLIPSIVVISTINVADAILTEAGLSFLGLGITPPTPDWGYDLSNGQRFILQGAWWLVFFPGIMIVLVVMGLALLGEGLSEILNPILREEE